QDSRYLSFTEISGPSSPHFKRLPYWVTEPQYKDAVDDTPAQFLAFSLKPNTSYSFRVRTYAGYSNPSYSAYSNTVSATTSNYAARYVCANGSDSNGGTSPTDCWRTIGKATSSWLTSSGRVAIVMAGSYAEGLSLKANGSATSRVVLMANPGDTVQL